MVATGLDPELVAAHAEFVSASGREDLFEEVQSMLRAQLLLLCRDGRAVRLEGLKGTAKLNGQTGVVACGTTLHSGERLPVQLGAGKPVLVRLCNLRPSTGAAARVAAAHALGSFLQAQDGVRLSSAVGFQRSRGAGVTVVAASPIRSGTELMSIPRRLCLSPSSTSLRAAEVREGVAMGTVLDGVRRRCGLGGELLDACDVELAVLVMHSLAANPRLACSWPSGAERRSLPVLWSEREMQALDGTVAGHLARTLRREVAACFERAVEPTLTALGAQAAFLPADGTHEPTDDPLRGSLREAFAHSVGLVKSRAVVATKSAPVSRAGGVAELASVEGGEEEEVVIVPLADLFNGVPSRERPAPRPAPGRSNGSSPVAAPQNVELLVGRHDIRAKAVRDVAAGEELIACYGENAGATFLLKYGVSPALDGGGAAQTPWTNPNDVVWLRLPPSLLPGATPGTSPGPSAAAERARQHAPLLGRVFELSRRELAAYRRPPRAEPPSLVALKATLRRHALAPQAGDESVNDALAAVFEFALASLPPAGAEPEPVVEGAREGGGACGEDDGRRAWVGEQAARAVATERALLLEWRGELVS